MSRTRTSPRPAMRLLLVGVSVVALLAGSELGGARPLSGGAGGRGGQQSAAANAAAAAAAANRQNADAAKRSKDSLLRARLSVEAMREAQRAAREAAKARKDVPNGLGKGGLDPAVTKPTDAALDPTGIATWQGAKLPTEVIKNGRHKVTVEQTDSRAILSWKTFNIGKDTTLKFDQDGNKDWVVLNRIVGGLDERGRRTAELRPSEILGSIKADGTVLVLNQNGTIFGGGSQVNVNSLGVTTAEIGRGFRYLGAPDRNGEFEALTLAERNAEFLQFGLLGVRDSLQTDLQREIHSEFMPQYDDVLYRPNLNPGAEPRRDVAREENAPTDGVFVEAGAKIETGEGGFVLLNSPRVENAGEIVAPEGNVSLVAQWGASLIVSDGSGKNGASADYRGVIGVGPTGKIAPGIFGDLDYFDQNGDRQVVNDDLGPVFGRNTGLIQADRGSIRLIENSGVLASTTSVSRNGYIAVDRAMPGSVISITADESDETAPQDPDSLANFKPSRIDIGYYVGEDALIYAPGADVRIGPSVIATPGGEPLGAQRVLIESGAVIDVGGLRDVLIPASRNAIKIGPLKGNELADDPKYRDSFLNGATIYVDPRKSGVREDGVAWVGSPLIEAESYYRQVGVKAEELLTRGGSVRFANLSTNVQDLSGADASDVIVQKGALIDISGGSVRYEGGQVRTSKFVGADGRIYDASQADPLKMTFIGFASGFTQTNERFGITRSWSSTLRPDVRFETSYVEGRDAGLIDLPGNVVAFAGDVKAGVVVGERQRLDAQVGTGESAVDWDQRNLQAAPSQLPMGGALRIGGGEAFSYADPDSTIGEVRIVADGDVPELSDVGYGRDFAEIDATLPTTSNGAANVSVGPRDAADGLSEDRLRTTYLSADMLSKAGFGQIEIDRNADVSVEAGAEVRVADGGLFTVASGRSIRVDGSIVARSGVVSLETQHLKSFTSEDQGIGRTELAASPFDVVINGSISVRGRWVNDLVTPYGKERGGAYLDGGTISLSAASRAFTTSRDGDPSKTRDVSGSVLVNKGATLDLAGGGRIDRDGKVDVSARGGDLSLVSQTGYFALGDEDAFFDIPSQHVNGFEPNVPDRIVAKVAIDSGATILSHGFGGGGTFRLVTPEFSFGEGVADVGTQLPMGFINAQGFSNYEITSFKTKIVENKFRNGGGYDAFLDTQTLTIGKGETLSLRNSVFSLLPSKRFADDLAALRELKNGGDLYSVLKPTTLDDTKGVDRAFYRQPVNLTLGGLIELKVEKGGALIGEAGAELTTPRLINEGLIRLPGGKIIQREILPKKLAGQARGVRDPYEGLTPEADGTYLEGTISADGVRTNAEAYVGYLLGELPEDVGVALRPGSVTDLAGVSLRDPFAHRNGRTGDVFADGRMLGGGTIQMTPEADRAPEIRIYPTIPFARFSGEGYQADTSVKKVLGLTLAAEAGAKIDLSGTADTFNVADPAAGVGGDAATPTRFWSDAGAILAPNGATIEGAKIDAHGGAGQARGGTLEIGDLVLTQSDAAEPGVNSVSADFIERSGFDLLHARGSVTSVGDVDLTLDRAFFLTTRDVVDQTGNGAIDDDRLDAVIESGGALSISARYVRLEGYASEITQTTEGRGGANSVAFSADQIDVVGAVTFGGSIGEARLSATGDLRLLGQSDVNLRLPPEATGAIRFSDAIGMHLAATGDLTLSADRIYPETGATALVTSSGKNATIAFERPGAGEAATPYSAGAKLTVQAAHIVQNGALFVPHGELVLGSNAPLVGVNSDTGGRLVRAQATETVTLGAGGLTSVSGGKIAIPYGVTTDLTEYFFSPGGDEALDATPEKRLVLGGGAVTLEKGATIDVSGGGDLFAYEFVPGSGGSRDVLDRLNADPFTTNGGTTYPDGRQVYAIVPGLSDATAAAVDPIFSAGYEALGSTSAVGMRVYLEAAPGLKAGWYTLLPAKYAVLPGGMRVVEQPGGPGLASIGTTPLPDGTIRVSGRYGQLGAVDARWRRFDVQTQGVFRGYSNIALTSAQRLFAERAAEAGETRPRLPLDAGSISLDALRGLTLDGVVKAEAAKGGSGAAVDIGGASIYVVADPRATPAVDGAVMADGAVVREIDGRLRLCADATSACAANGADRLSDVAPLLVSAKDLSALGAESLLIGGSRALGEDGSVEIRTTAQRLVVANDAKTPLTGPEILLAVGLGQNDVVDFTGKPVDPDDPTGDVTIDVRDGPSKALFVLDGAVVEARGQVADPSTADYVLAGGYVGEIGDFRRSSIGAVLRVANGPERLIRRPDADLDAPEELTSNANLIERYQRRYAVDLEISDGARVSGSSVLADAATYRNPALSVTDPDAVDDFGIPIPGGAVGWTPRADLSIGRGVSITAENLALGAGRVAFTDGEVAEGGLAVTHDLLEDLRAAGQVGRLNIVSSQAIAIDGGTWGFGDLALTAPGLRARDGGDVRIKARTLELGAGASKTAGCSGGDCGDASLSIDARTVVMTDGEVKATGFGGGVDLSARNGLFAGGLGGLDVGSASLTVRTPVIADRAFPNDDPSDATLPETGLSLVSEGAVRVVGQASDEPLGFAGVPGSSISIEGSSVAIDGARIRATAGALTVSAAKGDVRLSNGAVLEAPGYQRAFGDDVRSAPAGAVTLQSRRGDVVVGEGALVSVGGGEGKAGKISLIASRGDVVLSGELDGKAAEGNASVTIDSGGAVDLSAFAEMVADHNLDGAISIRSGRGDLGLGAGEALRAESVSLTADGGLVDVAGLIDTSGVNGGDVSLQGAAGVTLRDGARIDARATGYADDDSRRARAGTVTIATDGDGVISLGEGSTIDVSARRDDARLVPVRRQGQTFYRYVAADQGGSVRLRAPVVEQDGADTVKVQASGRIKGAWDVALEAFKRWDLDAIADGGEFSGVTRGEDGGVVLDVRTDLDTLAFDAVTGKVTVVDAGGGVNLLGDRGEGTVVSFIQDFDVSAAFKNLGGLAQKSNFHARAGVELASKGDVTLASNWNLGAGVVDVDAAMADGLMANEAILGRPAVVYGREAELISDYAAMTYRTGGRASGEAGVVSLRAGGDLAIKGTISDGFFQFRNQTDAEFLGLAMTRGREAHPETAPYSAEANTAAAVGNDAAGSAELFPLLEGDKAMAAFSYRLAAGADLDGVDPLAVNRDKAGTLSVEGVNSYQAKPVGSGRTRIAHYRNIVRTGAGSIDLAAAGSVDLRGEDDPIYVRGVDDQLTDNPAFGNARQLGGSAVYSAGHRAVLGTRTAFTPSGAKVTLDPSSLLPTSNVLREHLATFAYAGVSSSGQGSDDPVGVLVGDLAFAENGGDVTVRAGEDVLGRRDMARVGGLLRTTTRDYRDWSADYEPWRQGQVGLGAAVRINPAGFYEGFGALAGGDVTVEAGRDVSDVSVVATTALASAATSGEGVPQSQALITLGSGDASVSAGRDILGGRIDVASGEGRVAAGRAIASAGNLTGNRVRATTFEQFDNTMRLRLADATIAVSARGAADLQGVAALGVNGPGGSDSVAVVNDNSVGFYSPVAGLSVATNGDLRLRGEADVKSSPNSVLSVLPGSLRLASFGGDVALERAEDTENPGSKTSQYLMAPSPFGALELLAAGDLAPTTLAMSDADPALLPGLFYDATADDFAEPEITRSVATYEFPDFLPNATEGDRRRRHSEVPLHGDDRSPVLVAAGRDITGMILATPKQTRVTAGRDIVDMAFFGQNLDERDVTRIVAGRDITATTRLTEGFRLGSGSFPTATTPLPTVQGNTFQIGGPGEFVMEAGRNIGPFLNSATITALLPRGNGFMAQSDFVYGGGVLSIGNEDNPWLAPEGADVTVMFGVAKGVAWGALRDYYLDPANLPNLDDDLFEQVAAGGGGVVVGGDTVADRTKPIYGPKLIAWMTANAPEALEAETGGGKPDFEAAYKAFLTLPLLRQRSFLSEVYFNELTATADPDGPSYEQYQRGYQAVNLLFPAELGYTKNDLTGGSNGANEQVVTGNLDLRLATIQTSRGGDIRLFGPGGRVLAGSVVRTEQQIARRNYDGGRLFQGLPLNAPLATPIDAIPSGYEGLLTVRGGSIQTFTDGDVLLNQSRLFTQGGGDISMWSSNGDLNGGEGPKSSSNFPPVVVDTDYNGFSIEDRRGSATGAGIAAFQPSPDAAAPDIFLIAPRGTVDAGAAGIRVAGNLNVAAEAVANADNIVTGGASVGVPLAAAAPIGALTSASNASAAQQQEPTGGAAGGADQASIIIVEVLGYGGSEGQDCPPDNPDCKPQ
jgi:filamentous hemagglutinin family protein